MGASNAIELGLEGAREVLHVDRLVRTQEDVRTLESLPDLILDDLRVSTEHGSEGVRMEDHVPGVCEHIVETTLDVRDSPVRRPARARLVEERHLVRDLLANERPGRDGQPPSTGLGNRPEQLPEAQGSFDAQSIDRPGETFEILGESRRHVRDMTLARAVVVPHRDVHSRPGSSHGPTNCGGCTIPVRL